MNSLESEHKYFGVIAEIAATEEGKQILRHTDILNEKSGGLLTHVSIMIAAVALALVMPSTETVESRWVSIALQAEMLSYIGISMGALRSTFLTSPASFHNEGDGRDRMIRILRARRRTHNAMNKLTILLTVIFAVTVVVKLVFFIR